MPTRDIEKWTERQEKIELKQLLIANLEGRLQTLQDQLYALIKTREVKIAKHKLKTIKKTIDKYETKKQKLIEEFEEKHFDI